MIFFKVVPRPLGIFKQVVLGRFEPVVAHYGPWKIPKCFENGPFQDQKWVRNGSKPHFSKSDRGPFGLLKQMFLAHFQPVVTIFGPRRMPKCLENEPLWDQKCVNNGSKTHFSKTDPGPFGMLKQVFLAHFELVVTRFGPWNIPKCIEKPPFWDQKWVKNGLKTCFSKSDPTCEGHKQVKRAHFEPVLTQFSAIRHMYGPSCTLRTYLRAVWRSHLESWGEGCRLEDIYIYIYIYMAHESFTPPPPLFTPPPGGCGVPRLTSSGPRDTKKTRNGSVWSHI